MPTYASLDAFIDALPVCVFIKGIWAPSTTFPSWFPSGAGANYAMLIVHKPTQLNVKIEILNTVNNITYQKTKYGASASTPWKSVTMVAV